MIHTTVSVDFPKYITKCNETDTEQNMPTDTEIEATAREELAKVLDPPALAEALDPGVDMADGYGLTSLNKVLFLMSVCDGTGVPLSSFTEADVAAMHTLRDVITALARYAGTAA